MITQMLLDWISGIFAAVVSIIPPFNAETRLAIFHVEDGIDVAVSSISNFGILFPFDAINALIPLWLAAIGIWGASLLIALIFRLVWK